MYKQLFSVEIQEVLVDIAIPLDLWSRSTNSGAGRNKLHLLESQRRFSLPGQATAATQTPTLAGLGKELLYSAIRATPAEAADRMH